MIFVTGDTHAGLDIEKLNSEYFPENRHLTKADYLIVAGDFGFVWDGGKEEQYWLKWLERKNFTTLFVDGNHENFDRLNRYPVKHWNGGKIHRIGDSVIHLMRGQVFQLDGLKVFAFGGARSTDREFREEHVSWWSQEMPCKAEYEEGLNNLDRHGWEVDLIVSHTCPLKALEQVSPAADTAKEPTEINHYFEMIRNKLKYKHWYFGHFHLDGRFDERLTAVYQKVLQVSSLEPK